METKEYYFVYSNDNKGFQAVGKVFKSTSGEAYDIGYNLIKETGLHHWDVSSGYEDELSAYRDIKNYQESYK